MNDYLSELAQTEVSPEETRQILQRLAFEEFGGSENSRLGEIAEVTGASPEAIGRILADIRGESEDEWRQGIESRLDLHARQIEYMRQADSRSRERHEDSPIGPRQLGMRPFDDLRNYRIRFRKLEARNWSNLSMPLLVLGTIVILIVGAAFIFASR